jgi:hypothetical protein
MPGNAKAGAADATINAIDNVAIFFIFLPLTSSRLLALVVVATR